MASLMINNAVQLKIDFGVAMFTVQHHTGVCGLFGQLKKKKKQPVNFQLLNAVNQKLCQ